MARGEGQGSPLLWAAVAAAEAAAAAAAAAAGAPQGSRVAVGRTYCSSSSSSAEISLISSSR